MQKKQQQLSFVRSACANTITTKTATTKINEVVIKMWWKIKIREKLQLFFLPFLKVISNKREIFLWQFHGARKTACKQ